MSPALENFTAFDAPLMARGGREYGNRNKPPKKESMMKAAAIESRGMTRLEAKEGAANVIKALAGIIKNVKNLRGHFDGSSYEQRREYAGDIAALFASDVSRNRDVLTMPISAVSAVLEAAQASDTLGTLSG